MELAGLRGERVRLVPAEPEQHLDNAIRWFNDPAITNLLDHNIGVTRSQAVAFFERMSAQKDTDFHWALLSETDRHIGFVGLHQIDWRSRSAEGGLMIGERSFWGAGYASDAVRTRNRFAFEQLGLHRIAGHTLNPAMARVYEKCGYHHEGTARKLRWRNGQWLDAQRYAILEEDYFLAEKDRPGGFVNEMPSW
jgi:[ribosomal protein S5]-alanine N-acetyltransferase